jgi:hypothetical protein
MSHCNMGNGRLWTRILGTIRISVTLSKRLRSSKLMFYIPKPPSYMWQERAWSPSQNLHPTCDKREIERERDVWVLNPKGLVSQYLGIQDLDTHKCTQLIMRVSKMQKLVRKWSLWVPLRNMPWNINSRKRMRQSLEKWREFLKGTTWEEPIEASQRQSHGSTKEALEACPWTCPNPQENESRNPSVRKKKSHVGLMSVHAMRKAMIT